MNIFFVQAEQKNKTQNLMSQSEIEQKDCANTFFVLKSNQSLICCSGKPKSSEIVFHTLCTSFTHSHKNNSTND